MRTHNNPRWVRALQVASGVKHRDIAPTLAPEIQPVVIVEDLTRTLDQDVQPKLAWGGATANSLIATRGIVSLQNPAGSGQLVRANHVYVYASLAIIHSLQVFNGLALANNQNTARYSNGRVQGNPSAELHSIAQAAGIGTGAWLFNSSVTTTDIPIQVVLAPGQSLVCQGEGVGTDILHASFQWEEIEFGPRG